MVPERNLHGAAQEFHQSDELAQLLKQKRILRKSAKIRQKDQKSKSQKSTVSAAAASAVSPPRSNGPGADAERVVSPVTAGKMRNLIHIRPTYKSHATHTQFACDSRKLTCDSHTIHM